MSSPSAKAESSDYSRESKHKLVRSLVNEILDGRLQWDAVQKVVSKAVRPLSTQWIAKHCPALKGQLDVASVIAVFCQPTPCINTSIGGLPVTALRYCKELYADNLVVSFWMLPTRRTAMETVMTVEPYNQTPQRFGWGFRYRADNTIWWTLGGHGYADAMLESKDSIESIKPKKWCHIVGAKFRDKIALFINGRKHGETAVTSDVFSKRKRSRQGLHIGSLLNGGEHFEGKLADIQIFDSCFGQSLPTEAHIKRLAHGCLSDEMLHACVFSWIATKCDRSKARKKKDLFLSLTKEERDLHTDYADILTSD